MFEALDTLAWYGIVHADMKPDNILVDFDGEKLTNLKLIDFGSAFSFYQPTSIGISTPEYLAPEVLDYSEKCGTSEGLSCEEFCERCLPWSFDVWSFGAILLELLTGIPLWMSFKCRVETPSGKNIFSTGAFSVTGRTTSKIL
jgi:serine/threonine protein kinase